jgi:uncharacterized protein
MSKLLEPLNEPELARLDAFLLERIDPESDEDPGLISISGLDGLFTALVSGPLLPAPEQWLPVIWGEQEPEWEDEAHFKATTELMMRHLNTVAATLQEAARDFEPLFLQDEADPEALVIDDWCEGYARGVRLSQKEWRAGGAAVEKLLQPILAFSSLTDWKGHKGSDAEVEKLSSAITSNVRALYAYWH